MKASKIENSIAKYLINQATASDLDELNQWIQDPKNDKLFRAYIKTNYAIDYNMKKFSAKKIKSLLAAEKAKEAQISRTKTRRRSLLYFAAASVVIAALSFQFFLKDALFAPAVQNTPVIVNAIQPGTDKATLTLENGTTLSLIKGNKTQTKSARSNGEEIVYQLTKDKKLHTGFNYLTIPRGGQFHLVLSDGTKVWLNAETQIKYPVAFADGITRKVELIYGEAYFEVSPSTAHKGAKFKVYNLSQEVEVLGTQFNIKAYRDEANVYTTLVEGKVAVRYSEKNRILKPNDQSNLNLQDHSLAINTVDVYNEISWKDGVFSFRKKSLGEIMKVLSRWYDVEVQFENQELKQVGFNGVLGREQKIEDILKRIKKFKVIQDYEIKNKTIILK